MAELVAFLAVAAEAAEYVATIVGALKEIASFPELFNNKKDNIDEVLRQITLMKTEIITAVQDEALNAVLSRLNSVAEVWYDRDEKRIKRCMCVIPNS
jgi:hypothetical protein